MKMSQIFREAAQEIGSFKKGSILFKKTDLIKYEFVCEAITRKTPIDQNPLKIKTYFHKIFKPRKTPEFTPYFSFTLENPDIIDINSQEARRLALLLAAEIAESEGL